MNDSWCVDSRSTPGACGRSAAEGRRVVAHMGFNYQEVRARKLQRTRSLACSRIAVEIARIGARPSAYPPNKIWQLLSATQWTVPCPHSTLHNLGRLRRIVPQQGGAVGAEVRLRPLNSAVNDNNHVRRKFTLMGEVMRRFPSSLLRAAFSLLQPMNAGVAHAIANGAASTRSVTINGSLLQIAMETPCAPQAIAPPLLS